METNIANIPSTFQVIYTAYANFPAAADIGTLAYATDLGILYRWSGAAWQAITAAGEYHELVPTAVHNTTSHIAWEAWDISGVVPAGATVADILIQTQRATSTIGLRTTGSALVRSFIIPLADTIMIWRVPLTGTRIIELWDSDAIGAGTGFHVLGYWA